MNILKTTIATPAVLALAAACAISPSDASRPEATPATNPEAPVAVALDAAGSATNAVRHGTLKANGLEIFYREAGQVGRPQIVLLHGFPTSSHMFRNLLPKLGRDFHVIAPDFPGYGLSESPPRTEFDYTFANLATTVDSVLEQKGFTKYTMYLMDYGAPVGYRLAMKHPERVAGLIVQNGNLYEEGLEEFWDPIKAYWKTGAQKERDALRVALTLDTTKWQFQNGTRHPERISPDNWLVVQPLLDRPGNQEIQLDLFYDYRTNVELYPEWQAWVREAQPPTIITWGRHDFIFPTPGALPYLKDLPNAELHLLDTGHFVLEEDNDRVAEMIHDFLMRRVVGAEKSPR